MSKIVVIGSINTDMVVRSSQLPFHSSQMVVVKELTRQLLLQGLVQK